MIQRCISLMAREMSGTIHQTSHYRTRLRFVITLQLFITASVSCCPCRYCGPTTLCHRMNLREVPYTIPTSQVVRLLLYGNEIKKLTPNEFEGMRRVEELDLHGNQISTVAAAAFAGLENLKSLHLSENEIEHLPEGVLQTMPKLSRLFLDNNRLLTLPADIPFLHGLTKLNLARNQITSIEWSSFFTLSQLESAIFWSNPLQCDCNVHELIKWFKTSSKGLSIATDAITLPCLRDDIHEVCSDANIIKVTHLPDDEDNVAKGTSAAVYVQSESAYLFCNVTGKPWPLIVWKTPSSGYVYPYSNGRLTAYVNGTLAIHGLRLTDSGQYSCHPRRADIFGTASALLELRVVRGTKPRVKALKEKAQGTAGSKLQMQCAASGNPLPVIHWYAPNSGRQLDESNLTNSSNGGAKYSSNKNATILTISNFSAEDAGLWKCRASNNMGFDAAYIQAVYTVAEDNLLLIIIVVACVAVIIVIAAVILVTCLVRRRRRNKRPTAANRGQTESGNAPDTNKTGETATAVLPTENETTDTTLFTVSKGENPSMVILHQPYTQEPKVRGIRI